MIENTPARIMVKIEPGNHQATLAHLEKFYRQHNSGLPFEFRFMSDDYQRLYAAERRVSALSRYFAGMAVLISCLGLFALSAFTAERRLKEIGIRKILGSSNRGIVMLLSGDFTKMILLAILIALPISYFLVKNWLDAFAYRTSMEVWYFAIPALAAFVVSWLTIGMQTLRASQVNPTICLKEE
jgi:predicted lysophospholipase L1 biosynthesis ABC-type transport system permease subunit